jgi:HK97 family phage portal protein
MNSPADWQWFGGGHGSDAGEVVSEATALSISTVYACIRVLSESVASLPCSLYRRTPQGRMQAIDERLHYLLSTEPNPEMTAFTFFECLVKSMALCGNAYAEVERDGKGEPVGLWPLHPRETQPVRLENGMLAYRTSDGESGGQSRIILSQNALHVPLFPSFDGLVGLSPLQLTRQTLGQAIAAEKLSSRFFRNFSVPALAITIPEEVDAKTKTAMRQDWEALQAGGNAHRVAILDQGAKLEKLSLTPEECQFLETRTFLRQDIAAIYRVPVHMVGDNQRLSQASAEQLNLSFVVDSLRPYLSRIEGEIVRKLLKPEPGQTAQFVVEFDVSERLRGDVNASTNYYKTGIQFGWLCPNDVRRELNLNEGPASLNVFQTPTNMMNSDRLLDPAKQATTPPVDVTVED